jgi:sporulation protein YlmC with PRC-barrel domain
MVDSDGDKIGKIEEIYLDAETNEPEWAVVTTGLFGTKQTFVPIGDASTSGDGIRVPFDKATVKDAPKVDPDGALSQDEERQLYQHYGREYSDYSGPGGSGVYDTDTTTDRDTRRTTGDGGNDRPAAVSTDRA